MNFNITKYLSEISNVFIKGKATKMLDDDPDENLVLDCPIYTNTSEALIEYFKFWVEGVAQTCIAVPGFIGEHISIFFCVFKFCFGSFKMCLANFYSLKANCFLSGNHLLFWQPWVKGCLEPPGFEPQPLRFSDS